MNTHTELMKHRKELRHLLTENNIKEVYVEYYDDYVEVCYMCMNFYDRETFENVMLNNLLLEKLKKVYNNVVEKSFIDDTYSVIYIIKEN